MTYYDPNQPMYARCDHCGRNKWKVSIRLSNAEVRGRKAWLAERGSRLKNHPDSHPTTGYCPSCFADANQERYADTGAKLVHDFRGAAAKKATPIIDRLRPSYVEPKPEPTFETRESETGRRIWVACGHPAERDINDNCLTCGGEL